MAMWGIMQSTNAKECPVCCETGAVINSRAKRYRTIETIKRQRICPSCQTVWYSYEVNAVDLEKLLDSAEQDNSHLIAEIQSVVDRYKSDVQ